MTTPLHCKVCAKPLRGQQRLYCGRPCKRRAYLAQRKLREAQGLADAVEMKTTQYDKGSVSVITFPVSMTVEQVVDLDPLPTTPPQPSLLRRCYAYIQLLAHTLYHIFDGWRTR